LCISAAEKILYFMTRV